MRRAATSPWRWRTCCARRSADAEPLLRQGALASREPLPSIAIMIAQTLVDISLHRPQSAIRSIRAAREFASRLRNPPQFPSDWLAITEAEASLAAGDAAGVVSGVRRCTDFPIHMGDAGEGSGYPRFAGTGRLTEARHHDPCGRFVLDSQNLLSGQPGVAHDRHHRGFDSARRTRSSSAGASCSDCRTHPTLLLPFITFYRHRIARLLARIADSR